MRNDLYTETTTEITSESKSTPAPQGDSQSKEVLKEKDSVASSEKKGKLSKADCDRFVAAWNEAKPGKFCGLEPLTDSKLGRERQQIFESLVKESKNVDVAIAALKSHLRSLEAESYWQFAAKLENVASKSKLAAAVQSYCTNLKTSTPASSDDRPKDPTISELKAEAQPFIDMGWIKEILEFPSEYHSEGIRLRLDTPEGISVRHEYIKGHLKDLHRQLERERGES